ncbi:ATP12-domain-containing protein [Phanerochaete sordida]|uniref:ATP12-domain-containing protein n=1 Tax=Phanerochaete sordida TaxID=48140 RepID=A0A9P3GMI4_9APHY|nr:ATP12-domain-containing protein [Phanerochaete sordida]
MLGLFRQSAAGSSLLRGVRRLATEASSDPAVTATNRAQATLKRFWKSVGIEARPGPSASPASTPDSDHLAVTLDKRTLKTPSGTPLLLPKQKSLAATLIAAEWDNQDTLLKQHSLPMTSLASRAIDAFRDAEEDTRAEVHDQLLKYFETDTICFHATEPETLVKLQKQHWEPLLAWARDALGVQINVTTGFSVPRQTPETLATLRKILEQMDEWEMAAMERATYTSKSFLIGLALVKRHITAEQAAQASHVEVNSQIEKWGEVEDSHDVDFHDVRRQLGSAACIVASHKL